VQLPPNLPVPQGLTPSAQAALLEQRRESLAAAAKQQEERLLAMRNNNGNNKNLAPGYNNRNNELNTDTNFIGGSVLMGGINGNNSGTVIGSSSNKSVMSGLTPSESNSMGVGVSNFSGGSLSLSSIGVGKSGFNSALSIGAGGGSRLRQMGDDMKTDNNTGHVIGSGSRLMNGKNNGNFFNVDNNSSQRQPNAQTTTGPFRGQERWNDNNESSGLSSGSFAGAGSSSLFGNSPFNMTRGGIWANEVSNVVGSSSSSLSTSPAPPPIGYHGFPSSSSSATGMSPVGTNRSTGIHDKTNNQFGGSRSTIVGGGNLLGKNPFAGDTGSSTLASMLGIDLPTGSGSLRESNLSVGPNGLSRGHNPITNTLGGNISNSSYTTGHGMHTQDSLWDNSQKQMSDSSNYLHSNNYRVSGSIPTSGSQGAIGSSPSRKHMNNGHVGGLPIGGTAVGPVGGYRSNLSNNGSNTSDIALLQSLLPGVHITSGNAHQPAAPMSNASTNQVEWNRSSSNVSTSNPQNNVIGRRLSTNNEEQQSTSTSGNANNNGNTWGGVSGLYGGNSNVPHQNMSARSSIW